MAVEEDQLLAAVDPDALGGDNNSGVRLIVSQDPKLAVVPRFVGAAERAHLLDLAAGGWVPLAASPLDWAGLPRCDLSTSPKAWSWCHLREAQTATVQGLEHRLAQVAGQPVARLRRLVVVRCVPGTNGVASVALEPCHAKGPVAFVCLSTLPDDRGGETSFPGVGMSFLPRCGAALLWSPEERLAHDHHPPSSADEPLYGLYAFFDDHDIRTDVLACEPYALENCSEVDVRALGGDSTSGEGDPTSEQAQQPSALKCFVISTEPKVSVVPRLIPEDHAAKLAGREASDVVGWPTHDLDASSQLLRVLAPFRSQVVVDAEVQIAAMARRPVQQMGPLRLVRAGGETSLSDRGLGTLGCHVCLVDSEAIHLSGLGMQVKLRCGDAILWTNVATTGAAAVEDLRAMWSTLPAEGDSALGASIEATFHDEPVRTAPPFVVPQEPPPQPVVPPLAPNMEVSIGSCAFRLVSPIGIGSFGVVWGAERAEGGGGDMVIKETRCRNQSQAQFEMAVYEGTVLEKLTSMGADAEKTADAPLSRIPAFVASEVLTLSPELWCARVAMTRVPGMPLDAFLVRRLQEMMAAPASEDASTAMAGEPAHHESVDNFLVACGFARAFLVQLVPALEHISTIAFHRDINSHNVLISGTIEQPHFVLVDFGLAVDKAAWIGPRAPRSWHCFEVGGDARYWPPAGWYQFVAGPTELAKYPSLCHEYQHRLDFHALGITALQALDGAWLPPVARKPAVAPSPVEPEKAAPEAPEAGTVPPATADGKPPERDDEGAGEMSEGATEGADAPTQEPSTTAEDAASSQPTAALQPDVLNGLRWSWARYWNEAHRFWSLLFSAFTTQRHEAMVHARTVLMHEGQGFGVHNCTSHNLASVRGALMSLIGAGAPPDGAETATKADTRAEAIAAAATAMRPFFKAALALLTTPECERPAVSPLASAPLADATNVGETESDANTAVLDGSTSTSPPPAGDAEERAAVAKEAQPEVQAASAGAGVPEIAPLAAAVTCRSWQEVREILAATPE